MTGQYTVAYDSYKRAEDAATQEKLKTEYARSAARVQAEGEKLAKEKHAAWVETSAKTNSNVNQVFELCLEQIEKSMPSSKAEPPTSKCTIQ